MRQLGEPTRRRAPAHQLHHGAVRPQPREGDLPPPLCGGRVRCAGCARWAQPPLAAAVQGQAPQRAPRAQRPARDPSRPFESLTRAVRQRGRRVARAPRVQDDRPSPLVGSGVHVERDRPRRDREPQLATAMPRGQRPAVRRRQLTPHHPPAVRGQRSVVRRRRKHRVHPRRASRRRHGTDRHHEEQQAQQHQQTGPSAKHHIHRNGGGQQTMRSTPKRHQDQEREILDA